MFNRLIFIITIIFLLVASAVSVRAEDPFSPLLSPSSYDVINGLKYDIQIMVAENEKLEKEYQALNKEYQMLYSDLQAKRKTFNQAKSQYDKSYSNKAEHLAALESMEDRLKRLSGEVTARQAQNIHLEQKIYEIEQKNRIRKLQLADLQYEKRELLLELKTNEMELKTIDTRNMNSKELKEKLEESLQKEKELKQAIEQMSSQNEAYKSSVTGIKKDVIALEEELEQQKTTHLINTKEAKYLKDKKLYMDTYHGGILTDLKEENQDLQTLVAEVEKEYGNLNDKLELSINQKKTNQELIEDFIRMDKANQELRAKITTLQEKVGRYR